MAKKTTIATTIRLTDATRKRIRKLGIDQGKSMQKVIEDAIKNLFSANEATANDRAKDVQPILPRKRTYFE